jgi:hypothetical protein
MGAFAFFGMAMALFLVGVGAQFALLAASAPGVGPTGIAESRAMVAAGAVQRFSSDCIAAATITPGLVATSISVSMDLQGGGSLQLPAGASCMTTVAPTGGRFVYASAQFTPGMVQQLMADTYQSATWFRVLAPGQAQRISDGVTVAVPPSIPAGSVLNWVQLSS